MRGLRRLALVVALSLLPASAGAQPVSQPGSATTTAGVVEPSNLWLVAGLASTTMRGDCQTCEDDYPYRHAGSVLADVGYRVHERMDVGAEVFWVASGTADGRIRTTHLDAVAQFRPWRSQGFFLKGGAGMVFVRNWVDATGSDPFNSKAFSVVIGGGWVFRPTSRIGLQLFATQHAGAIGDLQTATSDVPDVMVNFWTLGVGVVFR